MVRKHLNNLTIFLYIFLSLVVLLGTFSFTIIIKSTVFYVTETGWLAEYIDIIIALITLFCIIFAVLFAKWLTIWFFNSNSQKDKAHFIITLALVLILSSSYWFISDKPGVKFILTSVDGRFTGGFYPDAQQLEQLKADGFTDVISLLDSLAVPIEPILINKETKLANAAGMNLINIPMLTASVYNLNSVKQIRLLATTKNSHKYYVHGYHDQERVLKFMSLVDQYNQASTKAKIIVKTGPPTYNFQRGTAIQIDNNLIVSPKPTKQDLEQFILSSPNQYIKSKVKTVVSINADETEEESKDITAQLKTQGISYITMPISLYPYNPNKILSAAKYLKTLSGTVLIYSYFMPPQSTVLTSIILSYLTNLPSLPIILLLSEPLQSGQIIVIAPNIALGDNPIPSEFKDPLQVNGIIAIAYIGPCKGKNYTKEQLAAKSIGLQWICYQANEYSELSQSLSSGGPWYVYGPDLNKIQNELTKSKLPLIPDYLHLVK